MVAASGLVLKNTDLNLVSGDPAQPTVTFVAQRDLGEAATRERPARWSRMSSAARFRWPEVDRRHPDRY